MAASVGLGQSPQDVTLADVNGDSWLDVIEVNLASSASSSTRTASSRRVLHLSAVWVLSGCGRCEL